VGAISHIVLCGSAYDATSRVVSQHVGRAAHTSAAAVQDMGVDHGCPHVLVSEEFLDGSDIIATFEQVRGPAQVRDKLRNADGYDRWRA